jgi:hypothetical protein
MNTHEASTQPAEKCVSDIEQLIANLKDATFETRQNAALQIQFLPDIESIKRALHAAFSTEDEDIWEIAASSAVQNTVFLQSKNNPEVFADSLSADIVKKALESRSPRVQYLCVDLIPYMESEKLLEALRLAVSVYPYEALTDAVRLAFGDVIDFAAKGVDEQVLSNLRKEIMEDALTALAMHQHDERLLRAVSDSMISFPEGKEKNEIRKKMLKNITLIARNPEDWEPESTSHYGNSIVRALQSFLENVIQVRYHQARVADAGLDALETNASAAVAELGARGADK